MGKNNSKQWTHFNHFIDPLLYLSTYDEQNTWLRLLITLQWWISEYLGVPLFTLKLIFAMEPDDVKIGCGNFLPID